MAFELVGTGPSVAKRLATAALRIGIGAAAIGVVAAGAAGVARWRHNNTPPAPAPEPPSLRSLAATNGSPQSVSK